MSGSAGRVLNGSAGRVLDGTLTVLRWFKGWDFWSCGPELIIAQQGPGMAPSNLVALGICLGFGAFEGIWHAAHMAQDYKATAQLSAVPLLHKIYKS